LCEEVDIQNMMRSIECALLNGKTPIIIDRSQDHNIDLFFSYGGGLQGPGALCLKMKPMVLSQTRGSVPVKDLMEQARTQLCAAMKHGKPLVLNLENSAPDFRTIFHDEADWNENGRAFFPHEVFRGGGFDITQGHWPDTLWRPREKEMGYAIPKDGFRVLLTTHFKPELIDAWLFGNGRGLPRPKHQFHVIHVLEQAPEVLANQRPRVLGPGCTVATSGESSGASFLKSSAAELFRKYEKEGVTMERETDEQWRERRREEIGSDGTYSEYMSTAKESRDGAFLCRR